MTFARDQAKARAWQQRSAAKAQANARTRASGPDRKPAKAPKPRVRAEPTPKDRHPAKPRKPLPKRNPKRLAALRLAQFGTPEQTAMIVAMPCICGGRHPACTGGPSDPSHVTTRGAGGKAKDQVPHSRGCHDAFHAHGRLTYVRAIGWTLTQLREAAARTWVAVSGVECNPRRRGSAGMKPREQRSEPRDTVLSTFVLDDGMVCTTSLGVDDDAKGDAMLRRLSMVARHGWRPIGPWQETCLERELAEDGPLASAIQREIDKAGT